MSKFIYTVKYYQVLGSFTAMHCSSLYCLVFLHLNKSIKLLILQTVFISAMMNVDFIPSVIPE